MLENLKDTESRLREIACPICKAHIFHIDPRTDKTADIYNGQCANCRYSFPIHSDVALFTLSQPDTLTLFKSIPCPSCEQRGVTLECRVQASVRDSYYLVTCNNCKHPFVERAWMDVYE